MTLLLEQYSEKIMMCSQLITYNSQEQLMKLVYKWRLLYKELASAWQEPMPRIWKSYKEKRNLKIVCKKYIRNGYYAN
ncbi:uncharacterized protein NEPG_01214 [Nematocida parisii ERTm1]|uniref:Uncharacterized protein n=1 Tax=Nematocida parisii (strain ERTm3) TaxID=935791 RepID=I3EGE5_NEMP3|nr:uncharacterized protein NEPG_01214 [Nematocida parisii ERTm1]EIJ88292.1 hypothetical protein NEQG_01736 [Nematocida parisii ERTm3]EIJ93642.1 hypothetical protein NEPG_01214 [Nematocida parisii ERTm1]|eukprot:XP_013059042.1 hypothetical protein NEPG_01214 [Nematocida parisii ERTm1]